jgi:hypothetical protein
VAYFSEQQLSEQEYLSLHAEVVALQQRLGISYKDASHRLYLREFERLKAADAKQKAFKNLERRIDNYLEDLNMRFKLKEVPKDPVAEPSATSHTHTTDR